ncbi:hypothetical protein BLA29_006338, partial [Euroglyphus maynei]
MGKRSDLALKAKIVHVNRRYVDDESDQNDDGNVSTRGRRNNDGDSDVSSETDSETDDEIKRLQDQLNKLKLKSKMKSKSKSKSKRSVISVESEVDPDRCEVRSIKRIRKDQRGAISMVRNNQDMKCNEKSNDVVRNSKNEPIRTNEDKPVLKCSLCEKPGHAATECDSSMNVDEKKRIVLEKNL